MNGRRETSMLSRLLFRDLGNTVIITMEYMTKDANVKYARTS
jgi:hypothetical protein